MLGKYRAWLDAEMETLEQQTQDAYVQGQLQMAKRAIARLDSQRSDELPLSVRRPQATSVLTALEMLAQRETNLDPALRGLRELLRDALSAT